MAHRIVGYWPRLKDKSSPLEKIHQWHCHWKWELLQSNRQWSPVISGRPEWQFLGDQQSECTDRLSTDLHVPYLIDLWQWEEEGRAPSPLPYCCCWQERNGPSYEWMDGLPGKELQLVELTLHFLKDMSNWPTTRARTFILVLFLRKMWHVPKEKRESLPKEMARRNEQERMIEHCFCNGIPHLQSIAPIIIPWMRLWQWNKRHNPYIHKEREYSAFCARSLLLGMVDM